MGAAASVRGLKHIEYYSELLNPVSKNEKFLHEQNIPIIIEIEKLKLSVYFRRTRTSHFLTRDLVILNNILSISHCPRLLTAGSIRNAEIMESFLAIADPNRGEFTLLFGQLKSEKRMI